MECKVPASDDYCDDIAKVLAIEPVYLLNWGKVMGKTVTAYVPEGITSEDDFDKKLSVCCLHLRWLCSAVGSDYVTGTGCHG